MHHRRLAVSLALLAAAAAVGAACAAGVAMLLQSDPKPQVQVQVQTVVEKPSSSPLALDTLVLQSTDGRTLNDAAYHLIQANEYARAIPFARRAVRYSARGTVTYGYATFNLGLARLQIGQCAAALTLLQRALKIEAPAQRPFIRPRIRQAQTCLQGGASGPAPSRSSASPAAPSRAQ